MKQVPFDRLAKSAKSNRNTTTTTTGSDNHKSPQRNKQKHLFRRSRAGIRSFVDGRQKLKGRGERICHSIFGPLADTCITTCQIRMMHLLLYMYMRALSILVSTNKGLCVSPSSSSSSSFTTTITNNNNNNKHAQSTHITSVRYGTSVHINPNHLTHLLLLQKKTPLHVPRPRYLSHHKTILPMHYTLGYTNVHVGQVACFFMCCFCCSVILHVLLSLADYLNLPYRTLPYFSYLYG